MGAKTASNTATASRRAAWIQAQKAGQLRWRPGVARVGRFIGHLIPATLLAAATLGFLIRVTVQDRMAGVSAYICYATPPLVLAALSLLAAVCWLIVRRRMLALAVAGASLACLIWGYCTTWYWNPPAATDANQQRVLFWNVAYGDYGWEKVAAEIRRYDADIVGLVESIDQLSSEGRDDDAFFVARKEEMARKQAFWQERMPDYRVEVTDPGITLLARRPFSYRRYGQLHDGWCMHWEVTCGDAVLHVVVVDVWRRPPGSRLSPLRNLYHLLDTLQGQPVLVMGDFNMPGDSTVFEPLRRGFANAFEVAGNGYAATWPVPLPVLTLDQAWFNEGVQVSRCELGWSWASDHRPILLELVVTP